MNSTLYESIHPHSIEQLKKNKNWYLALGICLIVLGSLAVTFTYVSTIISVEYLGFLLMTLGFFEAVQAFKLNLWSNFFLHGFLSILYAVSGFFIVSEPNINAVTLTLLLAIFLIVSGISKIALAYTKHIPHKGWLALNGAFTTILGILLWQQWPASGLWAIGLLLGVDAIFAGWSLIMLSFIAKNLKTTK